MLMLLYVINTNDIIIINVLDFDMKLIIYIEWFTFFMFQIHFRKMGSVFL